MSSIRLKDSFTAFNDSTPGIGVIVNLKGKTVYQESLGLANCELRAPIQLDSVFNLASVSKPFTGLAILQLMEQGELSATDQLTRFVPELKHYANEVSIYELVHHSAGFIDYNELLWQKARQHALHSDNAEVLSLLVQQDQLRFPPGSKFDYSNSNYVLLALIIERITGLSLRDYLKRYIFGVIGMENSKKWDDALYGNQLLGEEVKRAIFTPGLDSSGRLLTEYWGGYSYGWMIQERCGAKTIWHTGGDAGFWSIIVRFYELQFSVILLCNSASLDWAETYAFIERLYGEFR